jgi:aryl-alcohol dehydrogenase-like predicted oxidoreductase
MRYRRLGRSGLQISEIGLGSWLTYGGYVDTQRAGACVRRALELGVNFFDTADSYGNGAAERFLGRALRGVRRESYVLATKVFFPVGAEGPNESGLSRKHVIEGCHASLRRLRTDHVDIFFCHRPDPETPVEETLAALDDLVTQGKVLYVGVSDWSEEQLAEAVALQSGRGFDPIAAHSPEYSLLDRAPERGLLERCRELGVGVVSYQPLAQGVLAGRYAAGGAPGAETRAARGEGGVWVRELLAEERVPAAVGRLREIAAELGLTPAQTAIAWALRDEVVAGVITGASRPEQVAENAAAGGVTLPTAALEELDRLFPPS